MKSGGWALTYPMLGGNAHISVPIGAPTGSYNYSYDTGTLNRASQDDYNGVGTFAVVLPIPPPAPGPAYSWQTSVGGVNTANGNKMTVIPIDGWTVPGGMSLSLALTHNSQTGSYNFNGYNGQKWTSSYLDYMTTVGSAVTVYWGDGRVYTFTNISGKYLPPAGIYDTLIAAGTNNGITTYKLVTQSQVTYQFSQTLTLNFVPCSFLSSIKDQNGNTISLNYPNSNSDAVQSVSDSKGRSLTFTYSGGLMTGVTESASYWNVGGRVWTFGYTGSDLTKITLPALNNGASYSYNIGYDPNSHHDIKTFTDLNGNTANFIYNSADTLASAQDPKGNITTFTYTQSGTGSTTKVTDPNGNATSYFYAIQLRSVTDAVGKTASYDYDTFNTLTSQTDMRGKTTAYGISYNTSVTPEQITGTTTTDPLGNLTTTAYTPTTNKILSVTAPSPNTAGQTVVTSYAYDGNGNPTVVTSPEPNQVGPANATTVKKTIDYGPISGIPNTGMWGLPSKTTDAVTHDTEYGYDAYGNVNYVTHGTQVDTVNALYEAANSTLPTFGWLLSTTTHPVTGTDDTTAYAYDTWGRVTTVTAPDNTVTNTTYDANGNILRVEDANVNDGIVNAGNGGVTWTTGYFGYALQCNGISGYVDLGNKSDLNFTGPITISALIKPANLAANSGYQDIVAHGYGATGEVALRINNGLYEIESFAAATGHGEGAKAASIYTGDANAWVNLIGTFDGTAWHLYRNGAQIATGPGTQGAVAMSDADWALGARGVLPNNTSQRFFSGTIDDARIFDRAVTTSEVAALNAPGNPSAVSDGMLGYWRLDEGAGTTTADWCHSVTNSYDADNRLAWTFNGHLDFVQYFYDASSTLSGHVRNPYQASQLGLLSYKIDGNGHTTYYVYDQDNRPSETVRPDGTATTVGYDEDGNVKTRLDANGITATYTYDDDDRLTNVAYAAGGNAYTDPNGNSDNVSFAYYPDSLLQTMTDYTDATAWTYDNAGNTLSIGNATGRGLVSYTYDDNNLRQTMSEVSPAEAKQTWQYNYDDANRPANIIDPFNQETFFVFDQADRLTQKAFPAGTVTNTAYDASNEVEDVSTLNSSGGVLAESSYTYDPAGNVTTRTDNDGTVASFFYNGADQLTTESYLQSGSANPLSYTYDHNGNRTTQNYNGVVTSYAYNASDELTSDSNGGTYTYDHNGNWTGLTSGGSTYTFQYDAANRLTYYGGPSTASRYSYNGMNLRVAEYDSGSGPHGLINDGAAAGSSLLIDHNLTAKTVAHVYTPGIDQRDGLTGALHLMGVDALGTVRAFINDDGGQAVTDTFGTFAYGIPRNRTGSDAFTFAFAGADGYQTDPNGLILLGNRVYHPYTGRFLTRDPAHKGNNDYEYADDNPLREVDPSGLGGIAPGSVWAGSGPRGQSPVGQALNDYIETTWYLNTLENGTVVSSEPIAWDFESLNLPSPEFEHNAALLLASATATGGAATAYASNIQYKALMAAAESTKITTTTEVTTEQWLWGLFSKTTTTTAVTETTAATEAATAAEATAAGTLGIGAVGVFGLAVGGAYLGYEGSYYLVNNTHVLDGAVNGLANAMEK